MHVVYRFAVGGLENGLVNLLNGLPEAEFRHAVVALTSCDPAFCRRVRRADVEFVSLQKPPGQGWRLFRRMRHLLRDYRPAIVHTRNLAALEMQLPAWVARVPVRIHGEHGRDVPDPDGTNWRYRLVRRVLSPAVMHYVAVSEDLAQYLTRAVGIREGRVSCIYNGVDEVRFAPPVRTDEKPTGDGTRPLVVGTVGRLERIKGQSVLLAAVARLLEDAPQWRARLHVQLVGDGPMREALEREIADRALGDVVELLGERDDIPECMRAFDVFVLPSLGEGMSNTILEAMATALPVVATAVGGNVELVADGRTGRLVPAAQPAAMASAILSYLEDPALRHTHGLAGRAEVEQRFALPRMVDQYRTLYHTLLARAGAARGAPGTA
jgi:sugar transferase (PEP-CTERM/EpsH1 system associated)